MEPTKILHIVSVDKENYYLNNLVDHSDKDQVEYRFITLASHSDFAQSLEQRGCVVHCLDSLGRKNVPRAAKSISKILKEENPAVVHTHLFDPSLIGLTVAKRQGRKTVTTRHHSDAIHEISSAAKRRFYLALENYISRKSDHIIAPSRMVRDYLVDKEGVPNEKVSVIPYGQTTDRFDAVTPEKIEAVKKEFGMTKNLALVFVSRLFHRKGHVFLFEAFAGLVREGLDATLYLVGDGDKGPLEQAAAKFGISDRVVFAGWRDDALVIMAAADVVVHPSLEDALSSAVIESVMLERPIVATDISGVRDSLDDGKYGTIVAPANAAAFRDGLKSVLTDLESARQKAKAGRKYLLDYMDAKRVADEHIDLYKRLVG
jgi:glycosyltransferase involved in cell wall biosynthesis